MWKNVPIDEFKNSYEISNTGQIRNKKTLKIKSLQIGSTGYLSTRLDTGNIKKTIQIHSLVAEVFIDKIKNKDEKKIIVKFKDGDKNNVNSNNLYYDYQNKKSIKIDNNNVIKNKIITNEITINIFKGKIIDDYPNYMISKEGKIYSIRSNKLKISDDNNFGYCRVKLFNGTNKMGKNFTIHQLVANYYISNLNNYDQVNHIDLNKHNNNVDNLEWCDNSMNMKHNSDNKPEYSRKVLQYDIKDKNKIIGTFNSIKEASLKTNTNNTSIIHCCSGKYNTAGGYIWKYLV